MTEKKVCEKDTKKRGKKEIEKPETNKSNWAEDQKKRGYYYDDAHSYKIFNPDDEDEENE